MKISGDLIGNINNRTQDMKKRDLCLQIKLNFISCLIYEPLMEDFCSLLLYNDTFIKKWPDADTFIIYKLSANKNLCSKTQYYDSYQVLIEVKALLGRFFFIMTS